MKWIHKIIHQLGACFDQTIQGTSRAKIRYVVCCWAICLGFFCSHTNWIILRKSQTINQPRRKKSFDCYQQIFVHLHQVNAPREQMAVAFFFTPYASHYWIKSRREFRGSFEQKLVVRKKNRETRRSPF